MRPTSATHDTVIKPKPLVPAWPAFTLDEFTIDEQAETITCPGAHPHHDRQTDVTFGACAPSARCKPATPRPKMAAR